MGYCLIADDNPAIRKAVRGMLAELGFEADEAHNGAEALESCHARMPDAILLDWNMPVIDGLGVLTALGESGKGARAKIIFCTTGEDHRPVTRAMAAGASEYLVKPFDKDLLASKFASLGLNSRE